MSRLLAAAAWCLFALGAGAPLAGAQEGGEGDPLPVRRLGPDGKRRLMEWAQASRSPDASMRLVQNIVFDLATLAELGRRKAARPELADRIAEREADIRDRLARTLSKVPPEDSGGLLDLFGPQLAEAGVRLSAPWTGRAGAAAGPPPARRQPAVFGSRAPRRQLPEPGAGPEGRRQPERGPPAPLVLLVLAAPIVAAVALRRRIAAWIVELGTPRPMPGPAPARAPGDAAQVPAPGGYQILRRIGEGGMGTVFEALDTALERRVAIKRMRSEIRDDPREKERFLKEARTVAKLKHPAIIEIYAIVENAGELYLVFEFLEGRTLEQAVSSGGPMDPSTVVRVLQQACSALDYAHGLGVVHRDLKPSNIMLLPDGQVKVMDFGVARQAKDARDRLSMTNTVTGTPLYMAPEAEAGVVRRESDVYGMGVCLYEMLTGERPFAGTGAGLLANKQNMVFTPPSRTRSRLPDAVDRVVASALQADPERRPRTAGELAAALGAAIA